MRQTAKIICLSAREGEPSRLLLCLSWPLTWLLSQGMAGKSPLPTSRQVFCALSRGHGLTFLVERGGQHRSTHKVLRPCPPPTPPQISMPGQVLSSVSVSSASQGFVPRRALPSGEGMADGSCRVLYCTSFPLEEGGSLALSKAQETLPPLDSLKLTVRDMRTDVE